MTRQPKARGLLHKSRRTLEHQGMRGATLQAWKWAWSRVSAAESHVWYEMNLAGEYPKRELAPELALRQGAEADLAILDELPTVSPIEGRSILRDGNDLWLVLEGARPMFSCWIYRARTPVAAATGGWLALPDGTVCLEDSVTSAAARGRGIAPAAWAAIAGALSQEGQRHMITKVAVSNASSRRAVEKAGFAAVVVMHMRRIGPCKRTWVEVVDPERAAFFDDALTTA